MIICFVVETDAKCKSDKIYINKVLKNCYDIGNNTLAYEFMGGKGNYKKAIKEAEKECKNYTVFNPGQESVIIVCLDQDYPDRNYNDQSFNNEVSAFCAAKGYPIVWFVHEIEHVFLNETVENNKKKKKAESFASSKSIDTSMLNYANPTTKGKSNLMTVLNNYLELKK